jgi:regulator of protease activity HflC (stomatin/prohibitin superfamily)
MLGFNVFVLFLLVLFIFIVIAGVKVVPQGYNFTVERFGRYTRTLRPGLTLIIPFIDRVGRTAWPSSKCSTRHRRAMR